LNRLAYQSSQELTIATRHEPATPANRAPDPVAQVISGVAPVPFDLPGAEGGNGDFPIRGFG
jgi:hypothetical protein